MSCHGLLPSEMRASDSFGDGLIDSRARRVTRRSSPESITIKNEARQNCRAHVSFEYSDYSDYFLKDSSTATATATVAPTIGLLPMPMRPIISTCAGTEEEPAN